MEPKGFITGRAANDNAPEWRRLVVGIENFRYVYPDLAELLSEPYSNPEQDALDYLMDED